MVLLVLAGLRLARTVDTYWGGSGGSDLYPYWHGALLVQQQESPYDAYLTGLVPRTPIDHLVGSATGAADLEPIDAGGQRLSDNPAIVTPPLIVLLTPLALFSWPVVKAGAFAVNLALLLAMALLTWKVFEAAGVTMSRMAKATLVLVALSTWAPASTVVLGNLALVVFVCMLLGVLWSGPRPVLAGIALGVALSIPVLSIPVLVFYAYRGRLLPGIVALATQVAGLIVLSLAVWSWPHEIIGDYLRLLDARLEEATLRVDLAANLGSTVGILVAVALSIAIAAHLVGRRRTASRAHGASLGPDDLSVLGLLLMWGLAVFRNHVHDLLLAFFPLALLLVIAVFGSGRFILEPGRLPLIRWLAGAAFLANLPPLVFLLAEFEGWSGVVLAFAGLVVAGMLLIMRLLAAPSRFIPVAVALPR